MRRPGQPYMSFVPIKDKVFAPFLASYLADSPGLATPIRAQAEGYRYNDVPRLLRLYNQAASTPN
ncbi:hypothetical protein QMK33_20545 [Hymenobacter sp. H14-R3]|uniref:hypothetical protein n=1 Tax=Hymenobacter sp. H14-R3 TaxID=3046308 RepID=UPI0024B9EE03|nr:hypothetical protein [Hymenobacter sp. H14-R3]MDJ0367542.1 hypothetical protein [Hymenobacter sp. H14-R3]